MVRCFYSACFILWDTIEVNEHITELIVATCFLGFFAMVFGGMVLSSYWGKPYEDAVLTCSRSSQPTEFCIKLIDKLGK